MAFIPYRDKSEIPDEYAVDDDDFIIQIHGVHPQVMKLHFDLYIELMHRPGPLSRVDRELIGVAVSAINECEY